VYVLALARINVETIELDLLITHIFRVCSFIHTRPDLILLQVMATEEREYDVLIDCTGFTATSEIPLLWFKIFLELVPMDLVERFSRCFILNPNNAAAKFLRKLYHICGGLDFSTLVCYPLTALVRQAFGEEDLRRLLCRGSETQLPQ